MHDFQYKNGELYCEGVPIRTIAQRVGTPFYCYSSSTLASHVRAFGFFGGVTAQIVSDNLKAGVTKACFYDPAINRTYADLATHYDTAVVPRPDGDRRRTIWPRRDHDYQPIAHQGVA